MRGPFKQAPLISYNRCSFLEPPPQSGRAPQGETRASQTVGRQINDTAL